MSELVPNTHSRFDLSFTVDTTPDYNAGDVIDGLKTVSGVTKFGKTSGIVAQAILSNKVQHSIDIDLLIFGENPSNSTFTDNSALAVAVTDADKLIGVMSIVKHTDLGTPGVSELADDDCGLPFALSKVSGVEHQNLYVVAVARGTINFASTSDLAGALFIRHD